MSHEPFSLFHHSVLIWLDCFSMVIHCNSYEASMRTLTFLCFNSVHQNLGRIFGTSKMHLSPQWLMLINAAVCSKAVVLLLLIRC